ncbi:MAG: L-threonylcarbamoyladenylate synthase [Bacteroidales bacterium]
MEIKNAVDQAVKVLREGGVIIFPTDTVWGLGCDATNPAAVEKLLKIKNPAGNSRLPDNTGMVVVVNDFNLVGKYVKNISEMAIEIAEMSDTPLTIVYPGTINLAPKVMAKDGSAAIRVVTHPFCTMMLAKFGKAVVATLPMTSGSKTPKCLSEIDPGIVESADWVAHPNFDEGSTGKPSSILYIGDGGAVKVIRN